MPNLVLNVQRTGAQYAPLLANMRRWFGYVLRMCGTHTNGSYTLCVRLVSIAEMRSINQRYRGKTHATNVLTFCAETPSQINEVWLGDMVVCSDVILAEARRYRMPANMRWAHILVHGLLHLLGHDHVHVLERRRMEALEQRIMRHLGYPNPYLRTLRAV